MFELKALSRGAIPRALEKAERYRLLNEPALAESICLDILQVEPKNQRALVMLLLARTDQFGGAAGEVAAAREVLPQLDDDYERTYFAGIICEREGQARLKQGGPGSAAVAHGRFQEAMSFYEAAEKVRPKGNDDPLLRWNTCARILMRHPHLKPRPEERFEAPLE